jgi:hypothetical protein
MMNGRWMAKYPLSSRYFLKTALCSLSFLILYKILDAIHITDKAPLEKRRQNQGRLH